MLSSISRFGGIKGMVAMPDLSGLSRDAAIAAVQSAGLVFSSSSNVDSTSGNNGKIVSQSVSSGTLVDYESSITFGVGFYTAPSGPVIEFKTDTEIDADGATVLKVYTVNDGAATCVSPGVAPFTQVQKRKNVYRTYKYVDSVKDLSSVTETPTGNPVATSISTNNVADCGYTAPPAVTCTTSLSTISNGTCSNGYKTKTVMDVVSCSDGTSYSSGSPYNVTEECCVTLSSQTFCTSCICNSRSCTTTKDILCGSTTRTETTTNSNVDCTSSSQTNCA